MYRPQTMTACVLLLLTLVASVGRAAPVVLMNAYEYDVPGGPTSTLIVPPVSFDTNDAISEGNFVNATIGTGSGITAFTADAAGGFDLRPTAVLSAITGMPIMGSIQYPVLRGDLGIRGLLQVGWGSSGGIALGSPNEIGPDLLVLEWGSAEGFLVRVSQNEGADFSDWLYIPAEVAFPSSEFSPINPPIEASDSFFTWGTQIEYSDFGVPNGSFVTDVEFQAILPGDTGTALPSSNGFTFTGNGGAGSVLVNQQTGLPFVTDDVDPDIWYIASLDGIRRIPEPGALTLVVAGGLLALLAFPRTRSTVR